MDAHEKTLSLISQKGPTIPAQIATALNINQLFAAALLSELVERDKLRISHIKRGGSPLYFLEGQEAMLQDFYRNLPEKEQKAYLLLKEQKILMDMEMEPVVRVALRQIKDFAKPIEVDIKGDAIIFWRWYLLSPDETEAMVRKKISELVQEPSNEEKKQRTDTSSEMNSASPDRTEKADRQTKFNELKKQKAGKKTEPKLQDEQKEDLDFISTINAYFRKNNITVLESTILKKNSEIDFVILLPSPVGQLKYYCKARNKQRCSDADLSSAYVKGEIRKLPVLFLTTGSLTKKAEEMLSSELKNITFHSLG